MSLIGGFQNSGSIYDDSNVYYFEANPAPGDLDLGPLPAGYFIEEIKCNVIVPAPIGTTFRLVDKTGAEIIPVKKIYPDRQGTFTINNIGIINTDKQITGKLEGPAGSCTLLFIKKMVRLIQ